jgi:hypothetical protein
MTFQADYDNPKINAMYVMRGTVDGMCLILLTFFSFVYQG